MPLVEALVATAAAAVPAAVPRRVAARSLFDWCACVRAGDDARAWPLDPTARLALAAHLHDQDDLHHGSVVHPGGIVWSTVAACAREREVRVADAIAAAAFGYELTVRLAEAAGPEHRERWHATATAGTVGAAATAARLLGGDDATTADAVAHAASVAGGAATAMVERTATRFLHRAHAVTSGIACARVAVAGHPGARRILADGRGAFVLADPARLTAARSSTALAETGFRLHPATGFSHAAIDAARALAPLADVEQVRVTVGPAAAALASGPRPRSDDEAWWSIERQVAQALAVATDRVAVRAAAVGWGATVDVRLRDGSTRSAAVSEPLGHPDRPASDEDLLAKWSRLTGGDGRRSLERLATADDGEPFGAVVGPLVDWNRFQ